MSNTIEQKLANQLGAQQLEIIRLSGVIDLANERIKQLEDQLAEKSDSSGKAAAEANQAVE